MNDRGATASSGPGDGLGRRRAWWRRRASLLAGLLLILGAAYRVHLAVTLPVGYDEVYVMAVGLEEMAAGPSAFFLDVPMTRSSALAPLWWGVQYIPRWAAGDLSLLGLRMLPVLLGVATLWLAYRCAAARFGRRVGLIFLGFAALSDILIFTNCRGEFAESLTVPLIVLLACMAGRPGYIVPRGVVGALLLLTVFVKGVFVVGIVMLAEAAAALAQPSLRRRQLAGLAASLGIAAAPAIAYLAWAGAHFSGQTIHHDALAAPNVTALLRAHVFDYATIKAHVTGSLHDAAFFALDFDVWPVMALTAPLLVAGIGWGVIHAVRGGWRGCSRRALACRMLTLWAIVGAAAVIGRGTLGARFHLMYLPAVWMLVGIWLSRRRMVLRLVPLLVAAVVSAAYTGLAGAWLDWENAVLSLARWVLVGAVMLVVLTLGGWLTVWRERRLTWQAGAVAAALAALALLVAGPSAWASFARFEPMPRGNELAALDAFRSGREPSYPTVDRTLYIDLANYYLRSADTPDNRARALHFARLETERAPDDARGWAYLGEARLRSGDWSGVCTAWRRSLELAPNERLAQRLARLEASMSPAPP